MQATLYLPNQMMWRVSVIGVSLPTPDGYAQVTDKVAAYLGCARELVDVLASGPNYVAYSISDFEGPTNRAAMTAVENLSGYRFNIEDEEQALQGPVLIVTR